MVSPSFFLSSADLPGCPRCPARPECTPAGRQPMAAMILSGPGRQVFKPLERSVAPQSHGHRLACGNRKADSASMAWRWCARS